MTGDQGKATSRPPAEPADLVLALQLADEADAITMARFDAADLRVEAKPDLTPVTDADRAVERAVRAALAAARPADSILGEEYGEDTGAGNARRWVIDPIDGTKNFVRGVPVWATLIALQDDGRTSVGAVSAPALGRRWWAASGAGAWGRTVIGADAGPPRQLQVSRVSRLQDASLSYSGLAGWAEQERLAGLLELARGVWRTRAYGDFWSHVLVAEGSVDLSCEAEVSLWDLAALDVLVTEAGGTFTDLSGRPGPGGGSVLASNGLLHPVALSALEAR